jgi:hypothetical protein
MWVNLRGPWNGKVGYNLWPFEIFYRHLGYFMAIWYILWPLGNLVAIWYILRCFGKLCHENSGNSDVHHGR